MSIVSTCLIEPNVFFSEGLRSLLGNSKFSLDLTYTDSTKLPEVAEDINNIDLIIFGIDDTSESSETTIDSLKQRLPNARIVVLSAGTSPQTIRTLFSAGIDGYLLRNVAPAALIGSLHMIMAGEKVFPAAMLNLFLKDTARQKQNGILPNSNLSSREVEVLKYLTVGDSNKQIARHLDVTEATIKIHVKSVLRKLDLSNRTQAAVWAVKKGLSTQDNNMAPVKAA